VEAGRSKQRIVHSALDVKSWLLRPPSVEEARPGCCPGCAAPSRPVGGLLVLRGHGRRARQVRGPLGPDEAPVIEEILTRRYQCRACGAVVVVLPRALLRYRHFSGAAIAWALALFGVERLPAREVRRRTSPWSVVGATSATGWAALGRWVSAVRTGRLWSSLPRAAVSLSDRLVAARTALALGSRAPPPWDAPSAVRAFVGAAHAA
jgi:hypothetical protein